MKKLTPVEKEEIKREASSIGKEFVGFVDLPEKYRKNRFLKNIDMALYRLTFVETFCEEDVIEMISKRAEIFEEKKTTRILIGSDFMNCYESVFKKSGNKISNAVFMAIFEIESNKELYLNI